MAKQMTVNESRPGVFQRLQMFFEDVMNELKKVTWPTREDVMASTKVTLFLLFVMAVIIFVYDRVFGLFVMMILNLAG